MLLRRVGTRVLSRPHAPCLCAYVPYHLLLLRVAGTCRCVPLHGKGRGILQMESRSLISCLWVNRKGGCCPGKRAELTGWLTDSGSSELSSSRETCLLWAVKKQAPMSSTAVRLGMPTTAVQRGPHVSGGSVAGSLGGSEQRSQLSAPWTPDPLGENTHVLFPSITFLIICGTA